MGVYQTQTNNLLNDFKERNAMGVCNCQLLTAINLNTLISLSSKENLESVKKIYPRMTYEKRVFTEPVCHGKKICKIKAQAMTQNAKLCFQKQICLSKMQRV